MNTRLVVVVTLCALVSGLGAFAQPPPARVDITYPTTNITVRGPQAEIQFNVFPGMSPNHGGIIRETVVVGTDWNVPCDYYPPQYNYQGRRLVWPPAFVHEGPQQPKIYVKFQDGYVAPPAQCSVTVDVDLMYRVARNQDIIPKIWVGNGWVEVGTAWAGYDTNDCTTGNPHAPSGIPNCGHGTPHTYCENGDTPPYQPWEDGDQTQEPVQYGMGDVLTDLEGAQESWAHAEVHGHLGPYYDGQPVTWIPYQEEGQPLKNLGHYFIQCPGITAPCDCVRGSDWCIGIHGGAASNRSESEQMGCTQPLDTTYGCIRTYNGCPLCAEYQGLQSFGPWHEHMTDDLDHAIWIHVHF